MGWCRPALALIMSTTLQCIIVFEVFSLLGSCEHGRTEGWASRVVARGANLYGADIAGIIGNMVLINSGFHKRNNLSENIPQFGHTAWELFASPILCRKSLRNIGLKERRIIIVPGGPHVFGWPLLCGVDWYLPTFRHIFRVKQCKGLIYTAAEARYHTGHELGCCSVCFCRRCLIWAHLASFA